MTLRGPFRPPKGTDPSVWATTCKVDPGSALALWLEAHEGLRPEVQGSNRGPWLREVLLGGDGQPYCADLVLSVCEGIGAPRPLPFKGGAHWYWHSRAVRNFERAHQRGGTWAGPGVAPQRGWLVFWRNRNGSDAGPGGHVDVVTDYNPGERDIEMIGANVDNAIRRRVFRLGHPGITGFGIIALPVRGAS